MRYKVSYYDDIPESVLKCSNVTWDISFDFPKDPDLVIELLLSDIWPKAVDEVDIVKSEDDERFRANRIIRSMLPDLRGKRFLNVGDSPLIAELANSIAAESEHNSVAQLMKPSTRGSHDVALLYDIIDHIPMIKHHTLLESLISKMRPGATIVCRCHPWTGPHGGHCYNKLNKAYAHLFLDHKISEYQDFEVEKIYDPTIYYDRLFKSLNLAIDDVTIYRNDIPDLLRSQDVLGYLSEKVKYPAEVLFKTMQYIYIDYHLKIPNRFS